MGTGVSGSYRYSSNSLTESGHANAFRHMPEYVDGCSVSAGSGAREVDVASGTVWALFGYDTVSGGTLTLAENVSGQSRIDTVVVECDYSGNDSQVTVVQGTPSAAPVPPTLTRSPGVTWHVPLADVTVANGAGVLSSSDVSRVDPGSWRLLDLADGWSHYNGADDPIQRAARKLEGTRVHLRGRIKKSGTIGSGEPLAELPYRWWPIKTLSFPALVDYEGQSGTGGLADWGMQGEGDVQRVDMRAHGGSAGWLLLVSSPLRDNRDRWISLDGIHWDIDGNGRY